MNTPIPVAELSFEAVMAEFAELSAKLEKGQIPLAEAQALYDRAQALVARGEQLLAPLSQLA